MSAPVPKHKLLLSLTLSLCCEWIWLTETHIDVFITSHTLYIALYCAVYVTLYQQGSICMDTQVKSCFKVIVQVFWSGFPSVCVQWFERHRQQWSSDTDSEWQWGNAGIRWIDEIKLFFWLFAPNHPSHTSAKPAATLNIWMINMNCPGWCRFRWLQWCV